MFEIAEFKEMFLSIVRDGSALAIMIAVVERGVNMMVSFISGDKRIRF